MKQYKNILIIKMSSLGDILHALPTLYALRENLPNAKITWAVHPQFADILPGKPYVDEVLFIDRKKLKSLSYLRSLRQILHARHFDMVLDLQCIAKSAVVSFLSGASERYGYWELREGSGLVNKALIGEHQYDHVIERYLDTVRVLGGTVDKIEFPLSSKEEIVTSTKSLITKIAKQDIQDYIVIAPGARWHIKEWEPKNFADLTTRILATGQNVILVGDKNDVGKGDEITEQIVTNEGIKNGHLINLIGMTSLLQLMAVIKNSKLFISVDTGPLHLANALKKPLIALFGPTSPERTGPYGGEYVHLVISPTSKATIKEPLIDDPECMKQITVDMVWSVYKDIIHD